MTLTIDEAIKRLKTASKGWPSCEDAELYYQALEMGLNALERCKYMRTHNEHRVFRLKNETPE